MAEMDDQIRALRPNFSVTKWHGPWRVTCRRCGKIWTFRTDRGGALDTEQCETLVSHLQVHKSAQELMT
jgi:hypothetical protein